MQKILVTLIAVLRVARIDISELTVNVFHDQCDLLVIVTVIQHVTSDDVVNGYVISVFGACDA